MTTDQDESLWLTLEGNEDIVVPDVPVSWEMPSLPVCSLRKEEGFDVITDEMGLV